MAQCAHGEEAVARARRQRAVHRLRRCGSRCGGRGAIARSTATPVRRACVNRIYVQDGGLRRVRAQAVEAVKKLKPAPGLEAGRRRAAHRRQGGAKVEEHIGRGTKGARGPRRHGSARRPLLRADGHVDVTPDDGGARRDLRPGRAALPVQDRGRSGRDGQRHRVRAGGYLYDRRVWRVPRRSSRHGRHQHRPHLDRGRAVWRGEGVRSRAGDRSTGSRSTSRSSTLMGHCPRLQI